MTCEIKKYNDYHSFFKAADFHFTYGWNPYILYSLNHVYADIYIKHKLLRKKLNLLKNRRFRKVRIDTEVFLSFEDDDASKRIYYKIKDLPDNFRVFDSEFYLWNKDKFNSFIVDYNNFYNNKIWCKKYLFDENITSDAINTPSKI